MTSTFRAAALASIFCLVAPCLQQLRAADEIPHGQDRQPGPALSPEDALRTMTLREGFHLELFAAEPNLVNPVTMNFDEKGRVWVAESLEYPRRDAGPGRDRIQVLEDQDGDGRADKFTIFADDLNIPAGVLVGNGGVYVTNSPDILFLKDTDGDGKADSREVLYTGFGRFDTHELPNTLSWGPDGWIYGLNGVFNPATVRHEGRETRFDAALWRFHPRTRAFELFAEGTSNPWGVAWDKDGNAFVSACVIDHLYHLAETGYYHRQAGAYPPFTWKIESVVNHAHQKAAYCSLAYYDADVYPEPFRERLYMGNIHGNCINADRLERRGATYETSAEPDFLTANDAWFMPTAVRLGPDGCLYVLDWYDRYHCYQDANRDPQGIDRLKGRLYRVAYGASPRAGKFDLARETSSQLIERLSSPNLWWRDEAKRVLSERIAAGSEAAAGESLKQLVLDPAAQRKARIHALWTLVSAADPGRAQRILDAGFLGKVLALGDSTLRAWGVRAAGNARQAPPEILARVRALAADPDADVRLNVAVAARKLFPPADALSLLFEVLSASEKDPVLPKIVWRNAEPLLDGQPAILAKWFGPRGAGLASAAFEPLLGRVVERLLASPTQGIDGVTVLAASLLEARRERPGAAESCLSSLARALSDGEIAPPGMAKLQAALSSHVAAILSEAKRSGLSGAALVVACSWREAGAVREARTLLADASAPAEQRSRALQGLLATRDAASILEAVGGVIRGPGRASDDFLREALAGLARLESPQVATSVLEALAGLPPAVKSQAIDVLTQRPTWAGTLLDAVEAKKIDRSTLTLNQVRRLLALRDDGVTRRVNEIWGQVRAGRSPEREKVIARMRKVLDAAAGNAWKGKAVFEKTCLKCHTIFGAGAKVGPDITANGRETLDAVLANLLDPNLVIGAGYQAWTLATKSGRALSGLLVEDSPQRVILKVEGGKDEVIPRDDVDILDRSEVSLMPEDLEKTVTEDEFRDLIAFLRYEEAPPEPIATERQAAPGGAAHALVVEQDYGVVKVLLQQGGTAAAPARPREVLRYVHSADQRPYIHPLREPASGAALTALRPDDHPWQYGVFTGLTDVNGVDFWHEKGWIRSRGLEKVRELDSGVEIISRSDWLTDRRGGKRLLEERQKIYIHAPREATADLAIDFTWELTADEALVVGQHEYGGLAFRPAAHSDRSAVHSGRSAVHSAGSNGWAWQDISGRFETAAGGGRLEAGVAIIDHPQNPGYPNVWRVDDQGLINPAVSARGPLSLAKGAPVVFRYRIILHAGRADGARIDAESARWAASSQR